MPVSYSSRILGQIVNTQRMDVETPPEFIADTIQLLKKSFSPHRKVFRLQDIESVTGKLGHIASTAPWLCLLLPDLYAEIAWCLESHRDHLYMTNKQFRTLLKLHQDLTAPHNYRTFAVAKMARAVHLLRHQHFISKQLTKLMTLITLILKDNSILRFCPIAHLVSRDPSAIAYSDSSLNAAGGFSTDLNFWWHLQWPEHIQARAAKASMGDTISINALEYSAIIINYIASSAALLDAPTKNDPYLTALFFTDNVASEAWICKGAKKSPTGKALGFLQATLMIHNPVEIHADRISTTNNVIANQISQFPNHSNPLPHFSTLSQQFPQLRHCRRFHPSAELVSTILDALSLAKSPNPREPNLQQLAWPGKNTFLPSAAALTSATCASTYPPQQPKITSLCAMPSHSYKGKPSPASRFVPTWLRTTSMPPATSSPTEDSPHHAPPKPISLRSLPAPSGTTRTFPNIVT